MSPTVVGLSLTGYSAPSVQAHNPAIAVSLHSLHEPYVLPEFNCAAGFDVFNGLIPRLEGLADEADGLLASLYNYRGAHRGIPNVSHLFTNCARASGCCHAAVMAPWWSLSGYESVPQYCYSVASPVA